MQKLPEPSVAEVDVPRVSPAEYNVFVAGLNIGNIRLTRLVVEAPHAYTPGRALQPHMDTSHAEYVRTDAGFVVLQDLSFSGFYEGEAERAVHVEARFEASYTAEHPISDAIFEVFRATSLPLNTWPYFRELVHTVLARVGWPVLVLPVYKK